MGTISFQEIIDKLAQSLIPGRIGTENSNKNIS